MEKDYDSIIQHSAEHVLDVMAMRIDAQQLSRLRAAYELARDAHSQQRRKSGEPYIIHPIAVATIAAEELQLDADCIMAAFLHDVVEDTPYTIDDIRERFGDEVAYLVDIVTKKPKKSYVRTKQVDNYQQLLSSMSYDIRALMIKIADRLHNMRTLSSMRPDKQMKIAGETDYFYAPLANRLGLFDVKTDLENLSFKYRCSQQYADISRSIEAAKGSNRLRLDALTSDIEQCLLDSGIRVKAAVYWRKPFSIWRRMREQNKDFRHLEAPYYIRITFDDSLYSDHTEKNMCLKIYSALTDRYRERPKTFKNFIDIAKENSYKCIKLMVLSGDSHWEDIQICSDSMVAASRLGCMSGPEGTNVADWIRKFQLILKDIALNESKDSKFIEKVATSLYYDDVVVLTTDGRTVTLPQGATALDFAFELSTDIGLHAKFARINGRLASVRTVLHRGDCVEIGTNSSTVPKRRWQNSVCTYRAKKYLDGYFAHELQQQQFNRCPHCLPLPGGETIGFREDDGSITMHRRNCTLAVEEASKHGDSIVDIPFIPRTDQLYPVTIAIRAIDRYHFLEDIVTKITDGLQLSIDTLTTVTNDDIVDLHVTFLVHSVGELVRSMQVLYSVPGVDEVLQTNADSYN